MGDNRLRTISLRTFLSRLIWLCVLPPTILAVYLAIDHVLILKKEREDMAADIAHNVMISVDRHIGAHITALQMMADAPFLDEPSRFNECYIAAQSFHRHFGGHIVLADLSMQMIFNTRMPFGAALPKLPIPKGHAAAPAALATGQPAVGDIFVGPIAKEPLVAVVVPVIRNGRTVYLLVDSIDVRRFQPFLDEFALPAGWKLTLQDGKNEVMVGELPSIKGDDAADNVSPENVIVRSTVSPWSVVIEIPFGQTWKTVAAAAGTLTVVILGATMIGVLGGRLAGRKLSRSVSALAASSSPASTDPRITEIEAVRSLLEQAAVAREAAEVIRMESESNYRLLAEYASDVIWILDIDTTRFRYVSPSVERLRGYTVEEVMEQDMLSTLTPDSSRYLQTVLPQRIAKFRSGIIEYYKDDIDQPHKEGHIVQTEVTSRYLMNQTTGHLEVIGVTRDISDRKQAEQSLRRSEERLHFALKAAKAGTWEWDLRTNENFWSEQLWTLYGLTPHCCIPSYDAWKQTVHPGDIDKTEATVQESVQNESELNTEWRVNSADGSERWLMSRGQPADYEAGRATRYIGIVMDITERKRSEESLRESQGKLKSALENMADAVFISDVHGRFVDFNEAFARFHRFDSKEACFKTLAEYPDILDVFMADGKLAPLNMWAVPRALRGETVMNAEYTLRRKDTGETWVGNYNFAPIRDQDGEIVGSVVVGRDVTEQKEAVRALRKSLEEKESLLKEVHHRVKNNLQIVASLLSLQARRSPNLEVQEILEDTRSRVKSMALLHEALYRSENLAHINFSIYVKDLCGQLFQAYTSKAGNIRLDNRISPIGLSLEHAVPCGLIVSELVSNALKHAFPDGRSGRISVELGLMAKHTLTLVVSDDGIGLRENQSAHRSDSLGLQLVARLVNQLGGQMETISTANAGCTFRINFPAPENV